MDSSYEHKTKRNKTLFIIVGCNVWLDDSFPDSKVYGAHLGPIGPRRAPCWPHEPCYMGCYIGSHYTFASKTLIFEMIHVKLWHWSTRYLARYPMRRFGITWCIFDIREEQGEPYGVCNLCQNCFGHWFVVHSKPSHYVNQNTASLPIGPVGTDFHDIWINVWKSSSSKCIWISRVQNGGHFARASCYETFPHQFT